MGTQTVVALFASRHEADGGMTGLLNAGFPAEHIGFVEAADIRKPHSRKRGMAGIVLGTSSLAVAGAVTGPLVVGLSSIVVAAVAAVVGFAFGGYAGAVLGGLFSADARDDEPYFTREVRAGRVLVSVTVADHAGESRAAAVMHDSNALEVDSLGGAHLDVEVHHPSTMDLVQAA